MVHYVTRMLVPCDSESVQDIFAMATKAYDYLVKQADGSYDSFVIFNNYDDVGSSTYGTPRFGKRKNPMKKGTDEYIQEIETAWTLIKEDWCQDMDILRQLLQNHTNEQLWRNDDNYDTFKKEERDFCNICNIFHPNRGMTTCNNFSFRANQVAFDYNWVANRMFGYIPEEDNMEELVKIHNPYKLKFYEKCIKKYGIQKQLWMVLADVHW
jgi:hypothetical protein